MSAKTSWRLRSQRWRGGTVGLLLVAAALAPALAAPAAFASAGRHNAGTAQAAPYRHGIVPMRGHSFASLGRATSSANLVFRGGNSGVGVTTGAPRVYLVFWGSQWGTQGTNSAGNVTFSGDPNGFAPYVEAFIKGLGTGHETWSGVMTQYCQGVSTGAQTCPASNTSHVGYPTGGAFAGVWADESAAAPAAASGHQIGVEAVNAATHFGNTTASSNRSVQYVIISPHGTNPDNYKTNGFCAWHDWTGDSTLSGGGVSSPDGPLAFTNLPYLTDVGASCGQGFVNSPGTLDGVSIVEGHEYAETITDQFPAGGWTDSAGNENGDKCAWISSGTGRSQDITLTTGTFAVQTTWANDYNSGAGGCEVSHPIITNPSGNTVTVTSPGNQSSTVGTSVSLQIHASDSASGQTLTYSASGLPAGLAINATSGLISGTPTTPGTYATTVTAKDGTGASGSASFSWTVSSSSGCTAAQLLGNPGFESGLSPWTSNTSIVQPSSAGEPAHSGSYAAWFGFGTLTQSVLAQKVTLPTGCSTYTWSFWMHIDTNDPGTTQSAVIRVQVLSSTGALLKVLDSLTNLNAASGYQQHSYSLAAYAGQTVSVRLISTQQNTAVHTNFVLDDTALNVS